MLFRSNKESLLAQFREFNLQRKRLDIKCELNQLMLDYRNAFDDMLVDTVSRSNLPNAKHYKYNYYRKQIYKNRKLCKELDGKIYKLVHELIEVDKKLKEENISLHFLDCN